MSAKNAVSASQRWWQSRARSAAGQRCASSSVVNSRIEEVRVSPVLVVTVTATSMTRASRPWTWGGMPPRLTHRW
nr:hypothetical protein [Streptomyces sp. ST1020]